MQPRPLTYRAEIIGPLLASIAAGECCSVVGSSGVGKSNLLQQLVRGDLLRHHLGEGAALVRFVALDANMLAHWGAWGVYEGIVEAVITALGSELPVDRLERLQQGHEQLLRAPDNPALALRRCAEAIAMACALWRVVLVFDEFDPLFAEVDAVVLRNLRGLRDRHKYRLMFLTFSRQPLDRLRDTEGWDAVEPFVELLTLHELGLGPLAPADAADEVARFAARHAAELPEELRERIVSLSGGHPALLRALTQQALDGGSTPPSTNLAHTHLPLRLECAKIWQQLSGDEQEALLAVVRGQGRDSLATASLLLKGIVASERPGAYSCFSPLLAAYLTRLIAPPSPGDPASLQVNLAAQQVFYYGRDISSELSRLEYATLAYLWGRAGEICSVADTATAVYGRADDDDLGRMRTLAGRLRRTLARLAPDQAGPLRIYHMRGYQLLPQGLAGA